MYLVGYLIFSQCNIILHLAGATSNYHLAYLLFYGIQFGIVLHHTGITTDLYMYTYLGITFELKEKWKYFYTGTSSEN